MRDKTDETFFPLLPIPSSKVSLYHLDTLPATFISTVLNKFIRKEIAKVILLMTCYKQMHILEWFLFISYAIDLSPIFNFVPRGYIFSLMISLTVIKGILFTL